MAPFLLVTKSIPLRGGRKNSFLSSNDAAMHVNAGESIRGTGGNIDWIYPGRNEVTSYTIDETNLLPQSSSG